MIPAAVQAMRAVATHDLRTANAVLDPAVAACWSRASPRLPCTTSACGRCYGP